MSTRGGFIATPVGRLAYLQRTQGDGPTLLLCHATGFCKEVWDPVLDELASVRSGWTAVAIDQRHHGESQGFPDDFDWWSLAGDVLVVTAGRDPIVGVGHSGGAAAIAMAEAQRPGTFSAGVLIEPIIFPPPYRVAEFHPLADGARRRRRAFGSRQEVLAAYRGRGPFTGWDERALLAYAAGGFADTPGGVELRCSPEAEAQFFLHASAHGMWERLAEVEMPVELIAGDGSDTHDVPFLESLGARFGGPVATQVVPDATHFVPMESPGLIAGRIAATLDRLARDP